MKVGYARVSTIDQNPDLQRKALLAAGCARVFEDHVSGRATHRPGLEDALALLRPGDVLVVWKLDRLGRSLSHLIRLLQTLGDRGVGFCSLTESIDTTTASGRLMFHLVGAMAEFERGLTSERTREGLVAARSRGVRLGRRPSMSEAQIAHAVSMKNSGEKIDVIAGVLGVKRSTLYRVLSRSTACKSLDDS